MKKKTKKQLSLWLTTVAVVAALLALAYFFWPRQVNPTLKIFFLRNDRLMSVERPLNPALSPLQQALGYLLSGPSDKERSEGVVTLLPKGIKIRHLKMKGETIIIDFSGELENYGGGAARVEGLIAQIVYTATESPGVKKVWLWMDGQKNVVLGVEGLVLDRPLSREDIKF